MTQDANRLGEHIDIDELADAAEGLVSGDRAAEIEQHLAGCPDCTANADALNEVHRLLADAPVEVMPDDVFARLQGTLAEEQRQRETAGPGYHDSPSARPAATSYRTESGRPSVGGGGRYPKPPLAEHFTETLGNGRSLRAKFAGGALAGALLAGSVGFGGYVLSASAGTDEPPADQPMVVSKENLDKVAAAEARSGKLNAHRFSRAWHCVRQVTDGRVDGIRSTVMDGQQGYLVLLRKDGETRAAFVIGCDTDDPEVISTTVIREG